VRRWCVEDAAGARRFYRTPRAAQRSLSHYIGGWPYEPEDLRSDTAPALLAVAWPRDRGRRERGRLRAQATLPFDDWYWA
jgi:hypothetical protein